MSASIIGTVTGIDSGTSRVGSIDLAIPKLRKGSYFAEWLLEPRRR